MVNKNIDMLTISALEWNLLWSASQTGLMLFWDDWLHEAATPQPDVLPNDEPNRNEDVAASPTLCRSRRILKSLDINWYPYYLIIDK